MHSKITFEGEKKHFYPPFRDKVTKHWTSVWSDLTADSLHAVFIARSKRSGGYLPISPERVPIKTNCTLQRWLMRCMSCLQELWWNPKKGISPNRLTVYFWPYHFFFPFTFLAFELAIRDRKRYDADARLPLRQQENCGLKSRIKSWNTFIIFHNIFKTAACANLQQRETLHSSRLVLFQTAPLIRDGGHGPMLSYKWNTL